MNWAMAGAIAEVTGAVAVVVTLIYLAVEIRQSRNATESASIDALATGFNVLNTSIVENAEVAEVYLHGMKDTESVI